MRILITGSHGFIGSHIALHYAKDSQNKLCLIDNLSRHRHNLFLFDNLPNVEFWQVDLRDYETLKMIVNSFKPEVVIHASGQVAVTTSMVEPYDDFSTNVIGTVNLLETLRKINFKGKFIFTSTNKVYGGNVEEYGVFDQETRYDFNIITKISEECSVVSTQHTPYGCSKLAADLYVQEYGLTYGFETYTLRMSCIYGVRQFGIEDQGWIAHFIFSILQGKKITIFGDGKQVRDVLYVDDLVDIIDRMVKNVDSKSNVYNIGGGRDHTVSLLECLTFLEKLHKKSFDVEFSDWRLSDQKVYISDITRASKAFNWKPSVGVKEGITKLYNWVKEYLNK